MGLVDLKIEHIRRSKHWNERHRRMKQLRTAHNLPPHKLVDQKTSTVIHVPESKGTTHQKTMDVELCEAAKNGDVENFITCLEKFTKDKGSPLMATLSQLTVPDQDTFLHVAASYGHEELTGYIAHHFRELIICKNHKGDTPLHLAARAGHLGVTEIILRFRNSRLGMDSIWDDCLVLTDEEHVALVKQRAEERVAVNDEGNTALHEALLNDHTDIVRFLIKRNIEAAYYVNKQGKSPFYMAVEAGNIEYVSSILDRRSEYMHLLDEQLTKGKSLLQAAIARRSIAILQKITEKKPTLIHVKDEAGLGPLDFASSIGFLEGVKFLKDRLKNNTSDHVAPAVSTNLENPENLPELRIEDIRQSEHWEGRHKRLKRLLDSKKVEKSLEGPKHGLDLNSMNLAIYIAAKKGDVDGFINALHAPLTVIYNQTTPLKNTFLHVAASFGNEDLAGFIVHHFRSLLSTRNHRGNTALHVASMAGHLGVVDVLVRFQTDQMRRDSLLDVDLERNNKSLIGKFEERVVVNADGNTPLHEALMNNHEKVAEYLIKANVQDEYYVNKLGKSALYMAIEAKNIDCVKTILSTTLSYTDQGILDEEIKKGKSLLHATITARNIVLLQEIAKMKAEVIHVRDEHGQTPLHHAASTNYFRGVEFLLENFKMDIFEQDTHGFYPIHFASKNGHVGMLEKLLQHCPDAREFVNEDGQNILHVAAMYGKDSVVRYSLKTPGLELLLNEKDKDGNTPLHLATFNWYPKVVSSLTWDKRVDLKLVNNEGLTALEVAEENMETMTSYRQRLTWMALKSAGAESAKLRKKPKLEKLKSATYKSYNMDYYKDRVNTIMLVATLIATVTFAAGFTMPGGYSNSEPDQGMATFLNKLAFQVFVICDTLAVYSAIIVAVCLIWAQLGDITLVLSALRLAVPLLGISLTMMSLAFMVGMYLVVSKLVWLASVVLTLGIISVTSLLTLFVPFNLPYTSSFLISRYISYYSFCLLMLASGSYYDPDVEDNSF